MAADYSQLEAMLQKMKTPWYGGPVAQGVMGLAGGIGDMMSESPEEKFMKWRMQKNQGLYGQLDKEMQSPVIAPQQMGQMWGNMKNSLQPLTRRFADSPEQTRALGQSTAPLLMQQRGNLDMTNLLETLRRNMAYRGIQGGL